MIKKFFKNLNLDTSNLVNKFIKNKTENYEHKDEHKELDNEAETEKNQQQNTKFFNISSIHSSGQEIFDKEITQEQKEQKNSQNNNQKHLNINSENLDKTTDNNKKKDYFQENKLHTTDIFHLEKIDKKNTKINKERKKKKIGQWLVEKGIISPETLHFALIYQKTFPKKKKLGTILRDFGFITVEDLLEYLTTYAPQEIGDEYIYRTQIQTKELAQKGVIALSALEDRILVAGFNFNEIRNMQKKFPIEVHPKPLPINQIWEKQSEILSRTEEFDISKVDFEQITQRDPNTALKHLIEFCIFENASDVHIDPLGEVYVVRVRIDGLLHPVAVIRPAIADNLIARIKGISGLDIAERFIPQDGAFKFQVGQKIVNVRVATCPCVGGESCTLRILDRDRVLVPLEELGIYKLDDWKRAIRNRDGIILVTGATGSGKSTTLYATLNRLNKIGMNIITVEDPVEYEFPFIRQVQVNRHVGLDFAKFLRSALRQDPDVILIGEVRDPETAQIMIQAAETGHLVFATLHSNDIPTTFSRLKDLGLTPHDLKYLLRGILSQALLRKVCRSCGGKGCQYCRNTGYRGRVLASELELFDPKKTEEWIKGNIPRYHTILDDALRLYKQGITDAKEIERVFGIKPDKIKPPKEIQPEEIKKIETK